MNVENIKSSNCQHFPECGGCNLLHLKEEEYRSYKEKNLLNLFSKENLQNLPQINWLWTEPSSRRRITFQINRNNHLGFFKNRSKEIVEIKDCFIATKEIRDLIPHLAKFLKSQKHNLFTQAVITMFDNGLELIFTIKKDLDFLQSQKFISFAKEQNLNLSYKIENNSAPIFLSRSNQIFYPDFKLNLSSDIFIQATKSGLNHIIEFIRNEIKSLNKKDLSVVDIYAGFGAYSFAIIDLAKRILSCEGSEKMVDLISRNAVENNLSNKIQAEARDLFSSPVSKRELKEFDLAIINPPRNGASPQMKEFSKSNLKNIIYVSCNPQSFLRDAKILIDSGFKITKLNALDQFYGNKHLELIVTFKKK